MQKTTLSTVIKFYLLLWCLEKATRKYTYQKIF